MDFLRKIRVKNVWVRIFLSEWFGTLILVGLGNGSVANAVLFPDVNTPFTINWAYSLCVALGIYVTFNSSGGHVNPSITLCFAMLGKAEWKHVPMYFFSQIFGGFCSSPLIFGYYYEAMNAFDGGNRTVFGPTGTGGIFALYPSSDVVSSWSGLAQCIIATAFFIIAVIAVVDGKNSNPHTGLIPFLVGIIVFNCSLAFNGACFNPARDLGPRIFTLIAGWGTEVFSFRNYTWFWVPTVGPLIGSAIGTVSYQLFIGLHWPRVEPSEDLASTAIGVEYQGVDTASPDGPPTPTQSPVLGRNKGEKFSEKNGTEEKEAKDESHKLETTNM